MSKSKLRKNRTVITSKNTETRCERRIAVLKRNKKASEIMEKDYPQDIKDLLIAKIYKININEEKLADIKKYNPNYFDITGKLNVE